MNFEHWLNLLTVGLFSSRKKQREQSLNSREAVSRRAAQKFYAAAEKNCRQADVFTCLVEDLRSGRK